MMQSLSRNNSTNMFHTNHQMIDSASLVHVKIYYKPFSFELEITLPLYLLFMQQICLKSMKQLGICFLLLSTKSNNGKYVGNSK